MVSFNINLPEKVAVANLHGLYLAIPNGMYTNVDQNVRGFILEEIF